MMVVMLDPELGALIPSLLYITVPVGFQTLIMFILQLGKLRLRFKFLLELCIGERERKREGERGIIS